MVVPMIVIADLPDLAGVTPTIQAGGIPWSACRGYSGNGPEFALQQTPRACHAESPRVGVRLRWTKASPQQNEYE